MTVNLPLKSCTFTLMDILSGGEDASEIPRRDLLLKTHHRVGSGGGRGWFDFLAAKQKGHSLSPVDEQP